MQDESQNLLRWFSDCVELALGELILSQRWGDTSFILMTQQFVFALI